MPPLPPQDALARLSLLIASNRVMLFSKSYCPFCTKVSLKTHES
jgi:hypothetical protein